MLNGFEKIMEFEVIRMIEFQGLGTNNTYFSVKNGRIDPLIGMVFTLPFFFRPIQCFGMLAPEIESRNGCLFRLCRDNKGVGRSEFNPERNAHGLRKRIVEHHFEGLTAVDVNVVIFSFFEIIDIQFQFTDNIFVMAARFESGNDGIDLVAHAAPIEHQAHIGGKIGIVFVFDREQCVQFIHIRTSSIKITGHVNTHNQQQQIPIPIAQDFQENQFQIDRVAQVLDA